MFHAVLPISYTFIHVLTNGHVSLEKTLVLLNHCASTGIAMFTTLFSTTFSGYTVVGVPNEVRGVQHQFAVWLLLSSQLLLVVAHELKHTG
jgi:hypothetical protein